MIGVILAVGAVVSALAFGGTEPLAFALVQMAVVFLAVVEFWRRGLPSVGRPTLWVLGTILTIPLLQLIPLPAFVVEAVSPARMALIGNLFNSLTPLAANSALSVNSHATQLAILKLVCYVLVFLLAFRAYRPPGERTVLVGLLTGLGVFEAVYGTIQFLTGWQYIFTYAKTYNAQEATGTYISRIHFAGLLAMVLPFILAGILFRMSKHDVSHRSRWVQAIVSPLTSHLLRDIVLFAIICVGLVFSRSRGGIAVAIVGVLLVAALVSLQTGRQTTLAIVLVILALPAAYSVWIGLNPVVERFEVFGQPGALEEDRLPIWRDTLALIRDYPLLGTGLGTYRWASLHYQSILPYSYYEHAHNDYLEFAADIGIPAAVLLFGSLWVLVGKVARRAFILERTNDKILATGCAGAMTALLTHEITDFDLQVPANAFIFAWIAGTAAALVRKSAKAHASTGSATKGYPSKPFPESSC